MVTRVDDAISTKVGEAAQPDIKIFFNVVITRVEILCRARQIPQWPSQYNLEIRFNSTLDLCMCP